MEDDGRSDASSGGKDDDGSEIMWSALTAECYLPMLRLLDGEVHASLLRRKAEWGVDGGEIHSRYHFSPSFSSHLGRTIHGWTSSWFCSVDSMPMSVAARVVDFLMASHPAMPM